jgi:hypothetical protein
VNLKVAQNGLCDDIEVTRFAWSDTQEDDAMNT